MSELKELKEIKFVSPEKLGYYDSKSKARQEAADEALRAALQANITAEETRAKAEELKNSQAAAAAQKTADDLAAYVGEFTSETAETVVAYIDEKTAGIASDAALTELAGRVGQAEADIEALEGVVADNKEAIEGTVATLEEKVDANEEDIEKKMTDLTARVAANETAVGTTLPNAIALKADQTALEAEAETARAAEKANADAIKAISDDYLKAADKEELEGAIEAVEEVANAAVAKADYDVKVKALEDEDARIVGLVEAEAERAAGVEAGHEERIVKMEAFFEGAAADEGEGESLKNALDTLVEIQNYIDNDGAAADEMVKDIAANAKAIADHIATDHDFAAADAALKAELEAAIALKADKTTVEAMDAAYKAADLALSGRIEALEAIDHEHANKALLDTYTQTEADLADAVAKKHEHANAEELAKIADGDVAKWNAAEQNAKDYADGLNTAMDERMEAAEGAIEAIEESLAEGGATALAIKAAKDAADAAQDDVDALEEVVETKAAAADLTALAGRVTTEEGKSADFETRIATLEAVKFTEITEAEIDVWFEEA